MLMVIRNHLLWSGIGKGLRYTCVADITCFQLEGMGTMFGSKTALSGELVWSLGNWGRNL